MIQAVARHAAPADDHDEARREVIALLGGLDALDRGAITLGCAVPEGAELYFMKPRLRLVGHLRQEIVLARAELGQIRGALLFDCALRRLELERTHTKDEYARLIEFPAAGFHTHGESWLGHMHQTLTAIYFG